MRVVRKRIRWARDIGEEPPRGKRARVKGCAVWLCTKRGKVKLADIIGFPDLYTNPDEPDPTEGMGYTDLTLICPASDDFSKQAKRLAGRVAEYAVTVGEGDGGSETKFRARLEYKVIPGETATPMTYLLAFYFFPGRRDKHENH